MFSIIGRFFKDHGLGDLEKDTEYQGARDVKKAKLKMLKKAKLKTLKSQVLPY